MVAKLSLIFGFCLAVPVISANFQTTSQAPFSADLVLYYFASPEA